MQIYTRERRLGEFPLGAVLMLPLFGLPLGGWMIEHGHVSFGTCGLKANMGVPCLSCGATRGTLRLFHGDVIGAVSFQPMMMLIYLSLLIWGAASLWGLYARRRVVVSLTDREDLAFKIALILIPTLNWFYLWRMGI